MSCFACFLQGGLYSTTLGIIVGIIGWVLAAYLIALGLHYVRKGWGKGDTKNLFKALLLFILGVFVIVWVFGNCFSYGPDCMSHPEMIQCQTHQCR